MTTHVGRRRHDPYELSVTVRLPAALVEAVDRFAEADFAKRSVAFKTLLEEGLKALKRPVQREQGHAPGR